MTTPPDRFVPAVWAEIQAYLEAPTEDRWDAIHDVVVSTRPFRTLWTAIRELEPAFPAATPARVAGQRVGEWGEIPTPEIVRLALGGGE